MVDMHPECFAGAAAAFDRGQLPAFDFFQQCLRHCGPPAARVHHSEDDAPFDKSLFYKGRFGSVAAAIELYAQNSGLSYVEADKLMPLLEKSASDVATINDVRSLIYDDGQSSDVQTVFESPLFRQVLVVTAIQSRNARLAEDLLQLGSPDPPPGAHCVFNLRLVRMVENREIPASVQAALLRAGWAEPSERLLLLAPLCPIAKDSISLFEALRSAGYTEWAEDEELKYRLLDLALALSGPEVVRYLWDVCSVPEVFTNHMLVDAVKSRPSGGVEMIAWLLEQGLDVNWLTPPAQKTSNDPRDQAERDYYNNLHPTSDVFTALHGAAFKGNLEATEFLLEHGADPSIEDGLGQLARKIAAHEGHHELVAAFDRYSEQ